MARFLVKLQWLYKLAVARSFIVLTDKESVVCIPNIKEPFFLDDVMAVSAQRASLEVFRDSLDELIAKHDSEIENLKQEEAYVPQPKKATRSKKAPTKKASKGRGATR